MSAQYEKRVLGFDAWLQKQGYPSFCKVVMENGLAKLEIIVDAVTGLPRVFAVEAWIEFCMHDDRRCGEGRMQGAAS